MGWEGVSGGGGTRAASGARHVVDAAGERPEVPPRGGARPDGAEVLRDARNDLLQHLARRAAARGALRGLPVAVRGEVRGEGVEPRLQPPLGGEHLLVGAALLRVERGELGRAGGRGGGGMEGRASGRASPPRGAAEGAQLGRAFEAASSAPPRGRRALACRCSLSIVCRLLLSSAQTSSLPDAPCPPEMEALSHAARRFDISTSRSSCRRD